MADPNPLTMSSKTPSPQTQQKPSKFFSNFLYKAAFVLLLIALLPLFPSQAPEFANQTVFTQSWELLHLLLVGIAISYGLFSRRNSDPETEKEAHLKPDTPQSYVSRILQVSSVFDDEETESPSAFELSDETKIQTWNSQYHRGEPVVMVAEESTDKGSAEPLFLPVRSLKSRDGPHLVSKGEIGGKGGVVLPSPIPWRSRSGRLEMKEESPPPPYVAMGPSKIQSFRSPTPHSASTSPSPSVSPEIRGKSSEDLGRRRSFRKSSPPPAPPPPPLPPRRKEEGNSRDVKRSFKDELKDMSQRGRGSVDSLNFDTSSSIGRSVRTVRPMEVQSSPPLASDDSESDEHSELSDGEEASDSFSMEPPPEENEVDKKADEFIAKFREQIRLQRIASIKRSSGQRSIRNMK